MNIRIIYLAAGNGRRFRESIQNNNVNKLLVPLKGKPIWRHLYDRLEQILICHPDWEMMVVSRYEEILDYVRDAATQKKVEQRLFAVNSLESEKGVSYSIQAGIQTKGLNERSPEAYAFFVADQPNLSTESATRFLEEMELRKARLGSVVCKGVPGNPTWFDCKYREELLALEKDQGGRKVLRAYPNIVCFYEVENEDELKDIDIFGEMA